MYLFFFFSYFLGAKKVLQRRHKRREEFRFSPLLLTPPPLQTAKGVPPLESPFRASIYEWDHSDEVRHWFARHAGWLVFFMLFNKARDKIIFFACTGVCRGANGGRIATPPVKAPSLVTFFAQKESNNKSKRM